MLYCAKSCHSRPGGVKGASSARGRIGNKASRYNRIDLRPRKFFSISSRKIARICRSQRDHGKGCFSIFLDAIFTVELITILECADLSALWSAATRRSPGSWSYFVQQRGITAVGESGDRSPHSKISTRHPRNQSSTDTPRSDHHLPARLTQY